MKTLLKKMFTGWCLYENSWDEVTQTYTRDQADCMIEACGGDKQEAYLIHLFDYWSTDIKAAAAHYGLGVTRNFEGKLVLDENIPPPPSPNHYWDTRAEAWVDLKDNDAETAAL